jgi:hypothetical protein
MCPPPCHCGPGRVRRLAHRSIAAAALYLVFAAAGAAGAAPASPHSLTARVLNAGQLAGMRPDAKLVIVRTATAWSDGNATQATRLKRWGFAGGVAEALLTPGNSNRYGLSLVIQLSSAANARAALKAEYGSNGPWTHFAVPGIPGAVGFERLTASEGGRNIVFALGPFTYLVAVGWLAGARNSVPRSALITAAKLLYAHVR